MREAEGAGGKGRHNETSLLDPTSQPNLPTHAHTSPPRHSKLVGNPSRVEGRSTSHSLFTPGRGRRIKTRQLGKHVFRIFDKRHQALWNQAIPVLSLQFAKLKCYSCIAPEPLTNTMATATLCSQMTAATEHLAKARRTPSEEATEMQKPLAGNQNMDEDKAHAQSTTVPQHASVCKDLPKRRKVFEVLTTKSRIRWLYYWNSRRPSTNISAASRKKKRRQSSKS